MASFQTAGYPIPPAGFQTGYDYRTPPATPQYAGGHYYSPRHTTYATPPPKGHARRATGDGTYAYTSTNTTPRKVYTYTSPEYAYYSSAPPKTARRPDYERVYEPAAQPSDPRPRRASFGAHHAAKPTQPRQPQRPRTATKEKREATAADAARHNIPAGYSIKFWDPSEEPILLLGSVFDADSLGKWIYDWSAFFYGAQSPLAEEAGDLWVLLINLSHKIKIAEEVMNRVRSQASRDLLDEFLDSGERIWQRFNKLLKICESYMWKASKKDHEGKRQMGKSSGLAFVEAMFDRDCELRTTEKLMQHIRTWLVRYDANCLPITRDPSA